MLGKDISILSTAYYNAENYFFSSLSQQHQHFTHATSGYITGVDAPSLNLLFVRQADNALTSIVNKGIAFMQSATQPFMVVLKDDLVESISPNLIAQGYMVDVTTSCMQLSLLAFTAIKNICSDYEIKNVNHQLTDWSIPLKESFGGEAEQVTQQYQHQHQLAIDAGKKFTHFCLYVDKQPVCSLTLSIYNGAARLDDIGTRPALQAKGYATALIQHALAFAQQAGASHCFLEASSDGLSVYKRLGFETLFEHISFYRE